MRYDMNALMHTYMADHGDLSNEFLEAVFFRDEKMADGLAAKEKMLCHDVMALSGKIDLMGWD